MDPLNYVFDWSYLLYAALREASEAIHFLFVVTLLLYAANLFDEATRVNLPQGWEWRGTSLYMGDSSGA